MGALESAPFFMGRQMRARRTIGGYVPPQRRQERERLCTAAQQAAAPGQVLRPVLAVRELLATHRTVPAQKTQHPV